MRCRRNKVKQIEVPDPTWGAARGDKKGAINEGRDDFGWKK